MSELTGVYRGAVQDIEDPENRGRIRLTIPSVLGSSPSGWAEPTLETVQRQYAVGDRVWVLFENGDVNKPAFMSRPYVTANDVDEDGLTEAVGGSRTTFSDIEPTDATGYNEGDAWWVVSATDPSEILTFWTVEGGQWAQKEIVTADALVANNAFIDALRVTDLFGETLTGLNLQTRLEDAQGVKLGVVDGTEGIFVYDEFGRIFLKAVPAEGMAVVAGEVKARSLTVSSDDPTVPAGSSLGGVTEIATGGKVVLAAGTTAPKSAPTPTSGYETFQFENDGLWGNRTGLALMGSFYYTLRTTSSNAVWLEKWDVTSGVFWDEARVGTVTDTVGHVGGVTALAGSIWVLYKDNFAGWIVKEYNSSLNTVSTSGWSHNDGTRSPALGADLGTNELLIAQSRSDDTVRVRRYAIPVFGGPLTAGTFVDSTSLWSANLASVVYGNGDFGSPRYILANSNSAAIRSLLGTGVFNSLEDWPSGTTAGKVGVVWLSASSRYAMLDKNGLLRYYTSITSTTDANMTKWVSNTLATLTRAITVTTNGTTTVTSAGLFSASDVGATITGTGIPVGATITVYTSVNQVTISAAATAGTPTATIVRTNTSPPTYETDQSPRAKIIMPKRSRLVVSTSLIPTGLDPTSDPNRVRIYIGQGTTDPGRTGMTRIASPVAGDTMETFTSITHNPISANNPPVANTFPSNAGSELVAGQNGFKVDAFSNGSVGTGTFKDSVLTQALVQIVNFFALDPWHTVGGGGEPAFQNGWTSRDAPQFRKVGYTIFMRGEANAGTNNTVMFTLPTGYRPSVEINSLVVNSQGTGTSARLTIGTNGNVTVTGLSTSTWVALSCAFPNL